MTISHDEAFAIFKAEVIAESNGKIAASTVDENGTTVNAVANACAAVASEIGFQLGERVRALFLDTADDEDLSELGHDRYTLARAGTTAAVGEVEFTRTITTALVIIPEGTIVRTIDGIRFATDAEVQLAILDAGPVAVGVTAVELGVDSNVEPGTVDTFDGAPPQSDMVVTNPLAMAGGNEGETDEQYRSRVRNFFLTARRGTLSAIREGALAVDQVREAAAFELVDDSGKQVGVVPLIIADADGNSNPTLEAAVDLSLDDFRAAGVSVPVEGAVVRLESISYTVIFEPGTATPSALLSTRQVVVARVNRLDPNGANTAADAPAESLLTPGMVDEAVRSVRGVVDVRDIVPSAAVAPNHGEVIRTNLGLVSGS